MIKNLFLRTLALILLTLSIFSGMSFLPTVALAQSSYSPPSQSASILENVPFDQAIPIDESYRREYERCDQENIFEGVTMTGFRRCSQDKNNVKALLRFPDNTVFFEAKLSLDIDGSWKACKGGSGPTDQCPTAFNWPGITEKPNRYVDPDNYPYIVIPTWNVSTGRVDRKFRDRTGVNLGDVGVVVYKDKVVPIFVADGGPHNKLGEGSSVLLELIGEDRCLDWRTDGRTRSNKRWTSNRYCTKYKNTSVSGKVLFFIFPQSKIAGIKPDNAIAKIESEALKRFQNLQSSRKSFVKVNQPILGANIAVDTHVMFSGTAEPEVDRIKVEIGLGGPFLLEDLQDVEEQWSFQEIFRNKGVNRPVTVRAFDASGNLLQTFTFSINVS